LTYVRGWCADSRLTRVRHKAENERLTSEVELLREELRIKAARGWNNEQLARAFLVTSTTVASWLKRIDERGAGSLVQLSQPVNRFPDFVCQLVQQLKALFPAMGKVRIADLLGRAGLHLAATTVGRMLKRPTEPPPSPAAGTARQSDEVGAVRTITANYPEHVWNIDLTTVPTSAGFWVPWSPQALLQC